MEFYEVACSEFSLQMLSHPSCQPSKGGHLPWQGKVQSKHTPSHIHFCSKIVGLPKSEAILHRPSQPKKWLSVMKLIGLEYLHFSQLGVFLKHVVAMKKTVLKSIRKLQSAFLNY